MPEAKIMNKRALMKAEFQKWCYLKLVFFVTLHFNSNSLCKIHPSIILVQVIHNSRKCPLCGTITSRIVKS